jgi:hypothetical protein
MIYSLEAYLKMRGDALITERDAAADDKLPVYRLYGLNLASDFPFANRLAGGTGEPDLVFRLVKAPPITGWEGDAPAFASSPELDGVEESLIYVYRQDGYDVLRFTDVADYYLWPKGIVCHLLDPAYEHLVEIRLLGGTFSLWLELRGIPALHASAVVVGGRAAVFLATNSGGKSSLAASLMQAGYPLLTDDVLPLERRGETFLGRPGYPQMRMWPHQAQRFLGHYEDLDIVHPAYSKRRVTVGENGLGTFCDDPRPLACFYLPERRDPAEWGTGIEITPISRGEALMVLVGQSFVPNTVQALGLQPQRLSLFAPLVSRVPMRRLIYPDGFDYLPRVRSAILDDLAGLQSLHRDERECGR